MSTIGKLIISKELSDTIDILHNTIGAKEWSGVLFYQLKSGNIKELKDLVFEGKYGYPMDIGSTAATTFECSGELMNVFEVYPDVIPNLNYAVENVTRNKLKLKLTQQSVDLLDEKLSSVDSSFNFIRSNGVSGTPRANDFLVSSNVVYKGETIVPKVISTEETSTPKIHLTILNRIVNKLEELASNNLSTLKFENYVNNRQINNQ